MRTFSQQTEATQQGTPDTSALLTRPAAGRDRDSIPNLQRAVEHQAPAAGRDFSRVPASAARGIEGAGHALPHRDVIQASFGRHDLGQVRAHTHPAAAQALDARAYTVGSHVVFARTPDLHTAAHEAAHAVQQRAGVSLKGGVGEAGDAYERHADRVADAVVSGRSAEPLLDAAPRDAGSPGPALQRQPASAQAPQPAAAQSAAAAPDAPKTEAGERQQAQSPGDRLRLSILAAAEEWLKSKKEFMSQQAIEDVRKGDLRLNFGKDKTGKPVDVVIREFKDPVPNFTTCLQFAGLSFDEAFKKQNKGVTGTSPLLTNVLTAFSEDVQLQQTIALLTQNLRIFVKPTANVEAEMYVVEAEIKQIEGEADPDKQQRIILAAKRKQLRQLEIAFGQLAREKAKLLKKINESEQKLAVVKTKDRAWVRVAPGLPGGRPKPGEYVLWGQSPKKKDYEIPGGVKVALPPGAFLHISVLRSVEKVSEDVERWNTIDGGGASAEEKTYYIRKSDLLVFAAEPTEKNKWQAPRFMLLGWIDINTLVDEQQAPAAKAPAP